MPMANSAAGYIIQGAKSNRFLSRKLRFVKHSNREHTSGLQRAWVHDESVLLKGGNWTTEATMVYPARFNPCHDHTEIMGNCVTYEEFLREHVQRVV